VSQFRDLTGLHINSWTILKLWGFRESLWRDRNGKKHKSTKAIWSAVCDCGVHRDKVWAHNVVSGRSKSCGTCPNNRGINQFTKYKKGDEKMFGLKKVAQATPSATAELKQAVDTYVDKAIANTVDLSVVREELAQVVGFDLANRMVSRIAVGRGQKQVRSGGSYDARANVETR
jgi:hypothetical protein